MSKKNNKQRAKQQHQKLIENEKDEIRRVQERKKRKNMNREANKLTNIINDFNIHGNKKEEDDIIMKKASTYKRPQKAKRVRVRDREYIKIKKR